MGTSWTQVLATTAPCQCSHRCAVSAKCSLLVGSGAAQMMPVNGSTLRMSNPECVQTGEKVACAWLAEGPGGLDDELYAWQLAWDSTKAPSPDDPKYGWHQAYGKYWNSEAYQLMMDSGAHRCTACRCRLAMQHGTRMRFTSLLVDRFAWVASACCTRGASSYDASLPRRQALCCTI